jgi:hypothetical protein
MTDGKIVVIKGSEEKPNLINVVFCINGIFIPLMIDTDVKR